MEYETQAEHPQDKKRSLQGDLERFFQFWVQHKPLLDALERSSLSGILIERSIRYSVSEGVFPARFLPDEPAHLRQHVVMFGVCGLMTMMLQWHQSGYTQSIPDMAKVAVRLLTQPLFPNAQTMMK